jgi:hypothetical protein
MSNPQNNGPPDWDGRTERRSPTPNAPVTHGELDQRLSENRAFISRHLDISFQELQDLIKSGFPDGDPHKHREVHERLLRQLSDKRELWKEVREKTISGAVYSALIFIALAIWEAIKSGVLK